MNDNIVNGSNNVYEIIFIEFLVPIDEVQSIVKLSKSEPRCPNDNLGELDKCMEKSLDHMI